MWSWARGVWSLQEAVHTCRIRRLTEPNTNLLLRLHSRNRDSGCMDMSLRPHFEISELGSFEFALLNRYDISSKLVGLAGPAAGPKWFNPALVYPTRRTAGVCWPFWGIDAAPLGGVHIYGRYGTGGGGVHGPCRWRLSRETSSVLS